MVGWSRLSLKRVKRTSSDVDSVRSGIENLENFYSEESQDNSDVIIRLKSMEKLISS